jgi:predicted nuclease of restriction endonuclease-like (RecB) superfamily
VLAANAAMIQLYWEIGQSILQSQQLQGWGARVVDRLAADLSAAFPEMTGLSARNLLFMRSFAQRWPDSIIVKQVVSQLPWGHIVILFQRVKDDVACGWYIEQTIQHGWSRNILAIQIQGRAFERHGQAVNNFPTTLPPTDSDLAEQVFKDPYIFDFLGNADLKRERAFIVLTVDL